MIPLAIGGLMSMVPSAFKLIEGIRQRSEAKQGLEGLTRPEYQTPEEVQRMLNISQMRYADKFMPGMGTYMDRIEQQAANAFAQGSEAGNPFALISNIQANAGNQLANLGIQQSNFQLQNEQAYQQALMQMAGYKDQEWQMNEYAPYKEKYTEYRDMFGAGTQNIYGGLDSLSAIGTGLLGAFGNGGGMGANAGGMGKSLDADAIKSAMMNYQGFGPTTADAQTAYDDILSQLFFAQSNQGAGGMDAQNAYQSILGSLMGAK